MSQTSAPGIPFSYLGVGRFAFGFFKRKDFTGGSASRNFSGSSGVPKGGGNGGLFKSWSSRFAQKCSKICGGGGVDRADLSRSGL